MAKLTGTQLIVLSSAAVNNDGAAIVPERLNKAAALKVGSSLLARKLVREIRAKPGMAVWREDEEGRGLSLVILRAGRDAIGVVADDAPTESNAPLSARPSRPANVKDAGSRKRPAKPAVSPNPRAPTTSEPSHPRDGSKQALIITMLQKAKGASLAALIEATGWLPHTTRAALTGLRKRGFTIERTKDAKGTVYRIVDQLEAVA